MGFASVAEEFWGKTRSCEDVHRLTGLVIESKCDLVMTVGDGFRDAWNKAKPGDFVFARDVPAQVAWLAGRDHLDVLECTDKRTLAVRKPLGCPKVVCTLAVGEEFRRKPSTKVALALMRAYADRIGADFRVIRAPVQGRHMWYAKWRLAELLEEYERALYLDCDVLVLPECQDAFGMVPEADVGGYAEGWWRTYANVEWQEVANAFGSQAVGREAYVDGGVNAGVLVLSRRHRDMFDLRFLELMNPELEFRQVYDQTVMNWRRIELGYGLSRLPPTMNFTAWAFPEVNRFRAGMVHYAGPAAIKPVLNWDLGVVMDMVVNGRKVLLGISDEELKTSRKVYEVWPPRGEVS